MEQCFNNISIQKSKKKQANKILRKVYILIFLFFTPDQAPAILSKSMLSKMPCEYDEITKASKRSSFVVDLR